MRKRSQKVQIQESTQMKFTEDLQSFHGPSQSIYHLLVESGFCDGETNFGLIARESMSAITPLDMASITLKSIVICFFDGRCCLKY